jgi:hypothetical protein
MASRREALEAAFTAAEESDENEQQVDQQTDEELPQGNEGLDESQVDKKDGEGKETPDEGGEEKPELKAKEKTSKKEVSADEKERKAAAGLGKEQRQAPQQEVMTKAPNSWSPAQRERWKEVPADMRATILKREKEVEKTLSETDNVRRWAQDMAKVVNPHLGTIQAMGSQPLPAIQSLLQTATQLYGGNSETKASIVAQLIWRYGVDIKTLDGILANKKMPNGQPVSEQHTQRGPEAPPAWAQPLFGFMNEAQQVRQQAQQRMMQESAAEIEQAQSTLPFFEDVREDVADLMEAAYNRGRVLTLQDAYKRAVALNPEISKIVEQRNQASRQQKGNVERARRAASTIKGAPGGGQVGGKGKPASRREALEQAWDDATN